MQLFINHQRYVYLWKANVHWQLIGRNERLFRIVNIDFGVQILHRL